MIIRNGFGRIFRLMVLVTAVFALSSCGMLLDLLLGPEEPELLGTPTSISAVASASDITVTWDAVAGAEEYRVEYWTDSSVARQYATVYLTSFTVSVPQNVRYYFRVQAISGDEFGSWSGQDYATVTSYTGGTQANPAALSVGGGWTAGQALYDSGVWYEFSAIGGGSYDISWDDGWSGSGAYTLDVSVTAYRADGTTAYVFTSNDSAYSTPETISVPLGDGVVYINVAPYYAGEFGTFAIRVD